MSHIQEGLLYNTSHEWVRVEGDRAYVGISDHAQCELGDLVFVEGLAPGKAVKAGDPLGTVESVKAASDVFAPVSGTVTERNEALDAAPERINQDPYGSWIVALVLSDPAELRALMDAAAYARFLGEA